MVIQHPKTGQKVDCKKHGFWLMYLGWVEKGWKTLDWAWQEMLNDNEKWNLKHS